MSDILWAATENTEKPLFSKQSAWLNVKHIKLLARLDNLHILWNESRDRYGLSICVQNMYIYIPRNIHFCVGHAICARRLPWFREHYSLLSWMMPAPSSTKLMGDSFNKCWSPPDAMSDANNLFISIWFNLSFCLRRNALRNTRNTARDFTLKGAFLGSSVLNWSST